MNIVTKYFINKTKQSKTKGVMSFSKVINHDELQQVVYDNFNFF